MRTKKYSDRLNLAQSIHWTKAQKSLAKPTCQTCGINDAVGFDFKPDGKIVESICSHGHKSIWSMSPSHWVMMKAIHKLAKKNGYLEYNK